MDWCFLTSYVDIPDIQTRTMVSYMYKDSFFLFIFIFIFIFFGYAQHLLLRLPDSHSTISHTKVSSHRLLTTNTAPSLRLRAIRAIENTNF